MKNKEIRLDYTEMRDAIRTELGFSERGCEEQLKKLGFDIPEDKSYKGKLEYCDFWHLHCRMFRRQVVNDSNNSLYVGTADGIDKDKVLRLCNRSKYNRVYGEIELKDWQIYILEKWNKVYGHLADKNGWIKVSMSW